MHAKSISIIVLSTLLLIVGFDGCNSAALNSTWLTPANLSEGHPNWLDLSSYQVSELNGSVSLANDSSALYIRFYASDSHLSWRLRGQGMTLYLTDPKDKTKKLGIRYPIGMQHGEKRIRPEHFLPSGDTSQVQMNAMLNAPNNDLEFISSDSSLNGHKTAGEAEQDGVQASLSTSENGVEYDLRIERGKAVAWLTPGSQIGVEVESAAMEHTRRRGGDDESSDHEGGGPRGGMRPGGGGGEGGDFPGGTGGEGGWRGGGRHGGHNRGGEGDGEGEKKQSGIRPDQEIHFTLTVQLASPPPASGTTKKS